MCYSTNNKSKCIYGITLPLLLALAVGKLASQINFDDEKSRAERYKRLGMDLDQTVKVE